MFHFCLSPVTTDVRRPSSLKKLLLLLLLLNFKRSTGVFFDPRAFIFGFILSNDIIVKFSVAIHFSIVFILSMIVSVLQFAV